MWAIAVFDGPVWANLKRLQIFATAKRWACAFMGICVCALVVNTVSATPAQARTVDAGTWWLGGGLGPESKITRSVGGAAGAFQLRFQGSYALSSQWSAFAHTTLGIARTVPLRLRTGARYRLTGLSLPVSPYADLAFAVGRVFDAGDRGDVTVLGVRPGAGVDYFLTKDMIVGLALGVELGGTLGNRGAFLGNFDALLMFSHALPF